MKKILIGIILIYSLVFTMACPAKKTFRELKETSAKMKIYGTNLIQANIDAFRAGEVTQADLTKLNRVTRRFMEAITIYDDAIRAAETVANQTANVPTTTLDKLRIILDEQVVTEFFAVLDILRVLPIANSDKFKSIISGIRLTILAIQATVANVYNLQREQINC